ncbi:hypothetical protein RBH26_16400 [Natronolimnohabitans sp. A-GB9]|uniref:hypothetical protein n=1 Tax=Natronolimnohabitans sp. A-GB9 TaxID=3069757 RepID=UPI0027B07409|nr:hypothetical protein [Natronolimnohabitans sp. A-GB9]MDQ2052059.1 hypothetical protein [Natronolimnohabitans sp. A-GB9]
MTTRNIPAASRWNTCRTRGKTEKADELIDEIVYELHGLTDEEIEIVEEAIEE